jgi:hypothetical protein
MRAADIGTRLRSLAVELVHIVSTALRSIGTGKIVPGFIPIDLRMSLYRAFRMS